MQILEISTMTQINRVAIRDSWQQMLLGRSSENNQEEIYQNEQNNLPPTRTQNASSRSGCDYFRFCEIGPSARYLSASTYSILLFPFEYFFPSILPAFETDNVTPLREKLGKVKNFLDKVKKLAGIQRKIYYQETPNGEFHSNGGKFSFVAPVITLPSNQLERRIYKEVRNRCELIQLGVDLTDEELKQLTKHPSQFTDNEVKFLLLREMGRIKEKKHFLRTASKIIGIALFIGLGLTGLAFMSPLAFIPAIPLAAKVLSFAGYILFHNYVISRYLHKKADDFAVKKLAKYFTNNPMEKEKVLHSEDYHNSPAELARFVAIKTLEKMRLNNLSRKRENCTNTVFISKKGNDRRNISISSLTHRINRIRSEKYRA